jgi:hypothetical protein
MANSIEDNSDRTATKVANSALVGSKTKSTREIQGLSQLCHPSEFSLSEIYGPILTQKTE